MPILQMNEWMTVEAVVADLQEEGPSLDYQKPIEQVSVMEAAQRMEAATSGKYVSPHEQIKESYARKVDEFLQDAPEYTDARDEIINQWMVNNTELDPSDRLDLAKDI